MTKKDIDNIISIICPNDEDFEKPIISPAYLKKELEVLALEQEPCEDAISREDALMCLTGEIKDTDTIETIIARSARRIRKLPPVNPTKTGHWLEDEYEMEVRCSACGEENDECSRYCPNCGAKMVEPQESEG